MPGPESARRNGRDVRREQDLSELPQRTERRQWLLSKYVEHRAAQPSVPQTYDERLFIQQRAARHVHDDRRARQQIQTLAVE